MSKTRADESVIALRPATAEATPEKVRVTEGGERVISTIQQPSLTAFLPSPDSATGAAVVICPGGGHRELWMDHEGYAVARWLAARGIAAFVLKYRLAREPGSTYRVGVLGFSAGGEVAALGAARGDDGQVDTVDPVERFSSRAAFQALIYPGNARAIVPDAMTPVAFLLCGEKDRPEISQGLAEAYLRFRRAGMPVELHIVSGVGHGFGLRARNSGPVAAWPDRFRDWLAASGFLATARK